MQDVDLEETRAETLAAALLYLVAHYARSGCPRLALCVSRHGTWAFADDDLPNRNPVTY